MESGPAYAVHHRFDGFKRGFRIRCLSNGTTDNDVIASLFAGEFRGGDALLVVLGIGGQTNARGYSKEIFAAGFLDTPWLHGRSRPRRPDRLPWPLWP